MDLAFTIVLVIVGVLLGGYELVALIGRKPGTTISAHVWESCTKRPLIPFLFGLISGHFFWQR
jgi:hypothetical protein